MKDPGVGRSDIRAAKGFIGEPWRQSASRKPLHQVLLERGIKSIGIPFNEHKTWQPESMEESECDAEEGNDGQDSPCLSSQSERGSFRERGRVHRRDPVGYLRLHQAWLISPRHSRQPASDAAAPALSNGVR